MLWIIMLLLVYILIGAFLDLKRDSVKPDIPTMYQYYFLLKITVIHWLSWPKYFLRK